MRLGSSARQALETAYTLGHTSFESDQYQKPTHEIAKASRRGRITRDKNGCITIPPFAMCAATETRVGRTGTSNTICNGIEAGRLISAAESNRPQLHVLWLRTAYHPMDDSGARIWLKEWLFSEWKEKREKAPSVKTAGIIASCLDEAIDDISYRLRTGSRLIKISELCTTKHKEYPSLWKKKQEQMNWNRQLKGDWELLFEVCDRLDKIALVPVVIVLKELRGETQKECA